ncbi:MAG: flagellar FlbD family protein [Acidimicrobiales bacterium]
MICVHKLKGEPLWINPDQIVFVEGGHESVITLVAGKHVITRDTPEQVAAAVREHRAKILALASHLIDDTVSSGDDVAEVRRLLRSVPDQED